MSAMSLLEQALTAELWQFCREFVEKQNISCAEAVYQSDRVIENAYEFIEGICERVGYKEMEDEE